MSRLQDQIILVTGAGSGIGRAVALAYAQEGATIILLSKTLSHLEAVYDEIEALSAPTPAIYPMHLEGAVLKDYEELGAKLEEYFGRLDGLVHCAAAAPYLSRIKDYDPEDWMKVMQVNLNAAFMITQTCLPLLSRSDSAHIIFTSDQVGRQGRAYWGAYAVSKFGVEGLMQVLADELENSTIRINSIDPGPTRTALRKRLFPGEDPNQLKSPADLAELYIQLMLTEQNGQAWRYEEKK